MSCKVDGRQVDCSFRRIDFAVPVSNDIWNEGVELNTSERIWILFTCKLFTIVIFEIVVFWNVRGMLILGFKILDLNFESQQSFVLGLTFKIVNQQLLTYPISTFYHTISLFFLFLHFKKYSYFFLCDTFSFFPPFFTF